MADMDFSELNDFSQDIGEVSRQLIPNVRKGVEFAAHAAKDEWRSAARGPSGRHAKKYPTSIDYEMKLNTNGSIGAEIGPNLGRGQGSLGFLEDGGGGVAAKPQHAGRKAAKKAEEELEIGLLKAVKDLE